MNIFRSTINPLKIRDLGKSYNCTTNSFENHFLRQAIKNPKKPAKNAIFSRACTYRRCSPQWSPDPAGVPDRRSPYHADQPDRRSPALILGPGFIDFTSARFSAPRAHLGSG